VSSELTDEQRSLLEKERALGRRDPPARRDSAEPAAPRADASYGRRGSYDEFAGAVDSTALTSIFAAVDAANLSASTKKAAMFAAGSFELEVEEPLSAEDAERRAREGVPEEHLVQLQFEQAFVRRLFGGKE
jgi:hypothetical protein